MGVKFSNNAYGVLDSGITDSATTLDLTANGALFPEIVNSSGDYFYATITTIAGVREIIKCTHHTDSSDTFQVFERAQDGTSAVAFSAGDKVQIRFPKIILEEFRDDIAANLAAIESNDSDISDIEAKSTADEQVLYAPSGLTMWIYNPSGEIPTGWSAKSGPADALLAIAGGSESYDVAGETLAGSWTPTGHVHTIAHDHDMKDHTHTIVAHSHTGPSHTHTGPSHLHQWMSGGTTSYNSGGSGVALTATVGAAGLVVNVTSGNPVRSAQNLYTNLGGTGATGASGTGPTSEDAEHESGAPSDNTTDASNTANSGSSKEPSTDRPYAAVGLLIERD
jgi:hypothetical protein